MNRCANNGYLVDATHALPTDPTSYAVEGLPIVGCTHIRCRNCSAVIRSVTNVEYATPSKAETATLYDAPDPLASRLLRRGDTGLRLYLCRCEYWFEAGVHALWNDEPSESDPQLPWRCDGHPAIQLPHDLDGTHVATTSDLRDLAALAFRGTLPPGASDEDSAHAAWLLQLRARLADNDAAVVDEAALAAVEDTDPRVRSRALHYLHSAPSETARPKLFALLVRRPELFEATDPAPLFKQDTALEDAAWRVIAPLLAKDGRPRELAHARAMAGKATAAIYDALARNDGAWLVEHLDEIARAAPGRAGELVDSLGMLPESVPAADLRARIRRTLIGDNEPLAEIRAASGELAKRVRREVPGEGAITPIKHPLPSLHSGAQLELEIGAPAGATDQRFVQLRIKTQNGATARRILARGSNVHLIMFLKSDQVAERIIFQARDVEGHR